MPITQSKLEGLILQLLGDVQPPKDFLDWAKKWLNYLHRHEAQDQEAITKSHQHSYLITQQCLSRLLDMRLNSEIEEEVYKTKKTELEKELRTIDSNLHNNTERIICWHKKLKSKLEFVQAVKDEFEKSSPEKQKELLNQLGSNLTLKNNKIQIIKEIVYQELSEQDLWETKYKDRLEPQKYTDVLKENADLVPANPVWLPIWNEIRTLCVS